MMFKEIAYKSKTMNQCIRALAAFTAYSGWSTITHMAIHNYL